MRMPAPVITRPLPSLSIPARDVLVRAAGRHARSESGEAVDWTWRDLLVVVGWALGLRIMFALLTSDTYDPDEFVLLTLSRTFAHGAVPYRDFTFFHPPGILVILRVLTPIVTVWWPSARVLMMLVDTTTAVLTWRIGTGLYGRRGGLAAGLLYGASPLALVSGTRVEQDTLITALGVGGLSCLLLIPSARGAITAGICLGLAIWIKYPALLFLPVYIVVAPRRAVTTIVSTALAGALLFAPFASNSHALIQQTVLWQRSRPVTGLGVRGERLGLFWLVLNAPAIPGLVLFRPPRWLVAGFGLGGLFLFAPQLYEHYFVVIVPFAALLAAPLFSRSRFRLQLLLGVGSAVAVSCALTVALGGAEVRRFVAAAHFSSIRPVIRLLDRSTPPGSPVLSDRFEYAYLSGRPDALNYFWDMSNLVSARYLSHHLATAVVVTSGPSGFPPGFVKRLERRRPTAHYSGVASIWLRVGDISLRRETLPVDPGTSVTATVGPRGPEQFARGPHTELT